MIENEPQKVFEMPRNNLFEEKQRDTENDVAFAVDFSPALHSITKLIKSLHFIVTILLHVKYVTCSM